MTAVAALTGLAVDDDQVTPGVVGFLIVVALGVATWFLIRSMLKQLKKIDFDESETVTRAADKAHEGNGGQDAGHPDIR